MDCIRQVIRKRGIVPVQDKHSRAINEKVDRLLQIASELWPEFDLTHYHVPVVFVNSGRTAGYAKWHMEGGVMIFNIEFNVQAIELDWDDMINDTVPHEVAHIVVRRLYGKNVKSHGPEWKRVAKALGCSGERCHTLPLKKVRQRRRLTERYVYVGSKGEELLLSKIRHNKLQRGKMSWYSTARSGKVYKEDYVRVA